MGRREPCLPGTFICQLWAGHGACFRMCHSPLRPWELCHSPQLRAVRQSIPGHGEVCREQGPSPLVTPHPSSSLQRTGPPRGRCLPATCPSPHPMTHLGSTEPSAGPPRVRVDGIPHMIGQHHLLGVRPELRHCQRLRSWWDPGFRRGPLFSAGGLGVGSAQPLPC